MNESCHTYEWVMSHIWMSHVTHMNESRHTYEWVMSHIWVPCHRHIRGGCVSAHKLCKRPICVYGTRRLQCHVIDTYSSLRGGSSYTRLLMREHSKYKTPPGGEGSVDQYVCLWHKTICLFCKRALQKSLYSAKETYNVKEPTNRSHPIYILSYIWLFLCVLRVLCLVKQMTHAIHCHTYCHTYDNSRRHVCCCHIRCVYDKSTHVKHVCSVSHVLFYTCCCFTHVDDARDTLSYILSYILSYLWQ